MKMSQYLSSARHIAASHVCICFNNHQQNRQNEQRAKFLGNFGGFPITSSSYMVRLHNDDGDPLFGTKPTRHYDVKLHIISMFHRHHVHAQIGLTIYAAANICLVHQAAPPFQR